MKFIRQAATKSIVVPFTAIKIAGPLCTSGGVRALGEVGGGAVEPITDTVGRLVLLVAGCSSPRAAAPPAAAQTEQSADDALVFSAVLEHTIIPRATKVE